MRNIRLLIIACAGLALTMSGWAENGAKAKPRTYNPYSGDVWKTRPTRRDTPLREDNITDVEVAQVEAVVQELYPGSIVYISGVTAGCPCQDGPACSDQVWSVADRGQSSSGLALSKIDGEWQLGPLQKWWLTRDRIWTTYKERRRESDELKRIDYQEYLRRLTEHYKAFPSCSATADSEDT